MTEPITVVARTWVGPNPDGDGLLVICNIDTAAEVRLLFPYYHSADVGESMYRQSIAAIGLPVANERERPARLDA